MAHVSENNVLLLTDSYKVSHHFQYPPNTSFIYSYFESRGGLYNEVVFFGLQMIIKKYLSGPVVTMDKIAEAQALYATHFGVDLLNVEGWKRIVEVHGGCLPLRIRAVPEGTVVPVKNVLFTVENTDEHLPWLTNWFEAWYPLTVATNSRMWKAVIASFLRDTAGSQDGIDFKLHDFGFRGVSSVETAALGGMAHLVNFKGTDTVAGLVAARNYYGAPMAGFSVPASEHSTLTSWGKDGELDAFANMLDQFPNMIVACVSDSFNIWNACANLWGGKLKEKIMARKFPLVVRPDSGEPQETVIKCLHLLGQAFSTRTNAMGFRVLPDCIRLIQGDGIDHEMLHSVLHHMAKFKWSAENVAFGSGGALLQKHHRDSQKCAYKCSAVVVDGKSREIYKDPISDSGKKSKKGYLTLVHDASGWRTVQHPNRPEQDEPDELKTIFENGSLLIDTTFEQVRERAQLSASDYLPSFPKHTCAPNCDFDPACLGCTVPCSSQREDGRPCAVCARQEWLEWISGWVKQ